MHPASELPPRPPLPPSAELGSIVRWRLFALSMLLIGGGAIEVVLALPSVTTTEPAVVHGATAVMAALALVLVRVPLTSYRAMSRMVILATIVAITGLVATIQGVQMVPIFYVWPLLGAAYLLSRGEIAAVFAFTAGCYALALAIQSPAAGFPGVDYGLVLGAGVVVVGTVRVLAEGMGTTIDSLRHTSATDPLTGLLNRRAFQHRFARQFERSVFDGRPMTAMLIDIDHFKAINDEFGHPVGDRALVRFTELLDGSCRASDLIARVGGEEFAVVMPGATLEQAMARAEQFCSMLRDDRAVGGIAMTASVGIALRDGTIDSWEAMLVAADAAVYEAKRTGRDRIVVADASPSPSGH